MPKKTENKVPPCPYCADLMLLDALKGKPTERTYLTPNFAGRFWRKGSQLSVLDAFNYGARWVADVPPGNFAEGFDGFAARIIGVEIGFFLPDTQPNPPAPFSGHILTHLQKRLPFVKAPAPGGLPSVAYILFSGCVIEHESGAVEVRAHWWPSHGWLINQRLTLTASDPAERNAQLEYARTALDFFQLEARGSQKIKDADLFNAIKSFGAEATQAKVAERLGVSDRAVRDWVKRTGRTWGELKRDYLSGQIV